MPTAMEFYNDAAEIFGGVDRYNEKAVDEFFYKVFPTLDVMTKQQIVRFLLDNDGVKPSWQRETPLYYDVESVPEPPEPPPARQGKKAKPPKR